MLRAIRSCLFIFFPAFLPAQNLIDTSFVIATHDVLFDSDGYTISIEDSTQLLSIIDTSSLFEKVSFSIAAHTDADGENKYNVELSKSRTNAVREFLLINNVDSGLVETSYHGEDQPKADNETDKGKQQNRRAAVRLYKHLRLFPITGRVLDDSTNAVISNAQVVMHSKLMRDTVLTNSDGIFHVSVPIKTVVGIDASKPKYMAQSKMFRANPNLSGDTIEIKMPKMSPGKKFDLTQFYFVGSKAILLPKSKPELKRLFKIVSSNPEACFEIVGHVNYPSRPPVKKNTFEYNLSVARSKLIYNYLIDNGIEPHRLFYSAKGNWEMLFPKTRNEREMQINRRVEIHVRKCSIVSESTNAILDEAGYNFYNK